MNRIEEYKARINVTRQEGLQKAKCDVDDARAELHTEIERLTGIIAVYKEKITIRERENRNLIVEQKVTTEKITKLIEEKKTISIDIRIDEERKLRVEYDAKLTELRNELNEQRRKYEFEISNLRSVQLQKQTELENLKRHIRPISSKLFRSHPSTYSFDDEINVSFRVYKALNNLFVYVFTRKFQNV